MSRFASAPSAAVGVRNLQRAGESVARRKEIWQRSGRETAGQRAAFLSARKLTFVMAP